MLHRCTLSRWWAARCSSCTTPPDRPRSGWSTSGRLSLCLRTKPWTTAPPGPRETARMATCGALTIWSKSWVPCCRKPPWSNFRGPSSAPPVLEPGVFGRNRLERGKEDTNFLNMSHGDAWGLGKAVLTAPSRGPKVGWGLFAEKEEMRLDTNHQLWQGGD